LIKEYTWDNAYKKLKEAISNPLF